MPDDSFYGFEPEQETALSAEDEATLKEVQDALQETEQRLLEVLNCTAPEDRDLKVKCTIPVRGDDWKAWQMLTHRLLDTRMMSKSEFIMEIFRYRMRSMLSMEHGHALMAATHAAVMNSLPPDVRARISMSRVREGLKDYRERSRKAAREMFETEQSLSVEPKKEGGAL